jgi:hypothetical protein
MTAAIPGYPGSSSDPRGCEKSCGRHERVERARTGQERRAPICEDRPNFAASFCNFSPFPSPGCRCWEISTIVSPGKRYSLCSRESDMGSAVHGAKVAFVCNTNRPSKSYLAPFSAAVAAAAVPNAMHAISCLHVRPRFRCRAEEGATLQFFMSFDLR